MACKTTTPTTLILPDDLPVVQMTGDDNIDITRLLVQDVRWRLFATTARWVAGSITNQEYEEKTASLIQILGDCYGDE